MGVDTSARGSESTKRKTKVATILKISFEPLGGILSSWREGTEPSNRETT